MKTIIEDDCLPRCKFLSTNFPGIEVKLDLFHACMRVVQAFPKSDSQHRKFASEFSMVFRRNGDLGDERTMSTRKRLTQILKGYCSSGIDS